ncbi:transporter [Ruminococcus sp. CLA-AA-H200]|uniref:Transporter n=1 Tax=Ruminococcus turbiniformis TaxID=2881258 RepID=A0ABS8FVD6_9FIRM|nr:transporter [Ruminococcus turbiniformis]MCC2253990.1 transporter [Ruminococcus turbiniformis]
MGKYAILFLTYLTRVLEFIIAVLLACGIIIMTFDMAVSIDALTNLSIYPNYDDLLTGCFNLIIGVELIRMLYLHTPITVFEVLLFAIARQIIVDHSSPLNSLLGVIAIAILFATRRFLFSPFDETDKTIFRSSQKVYQVNRLFGLSIPYEEKSDSLLDVFLAKANEEGADIGTGACVYFSDFGLRIAKMRDGKITRIEVIRSIQQ